MVIWLVCELVAVFVLPYCFSDSVFLNLYLDEKVSISTQRFLNNENANIPNAVTGWSNKPNDTRDQWITDKYGSRSANPAVFDRNDKSRVIFLGSSMINGGADVTNRETMSAYLDSDSVETFNFGSMLYSVDQSFLAFRSKIMAFKPDVVVVGIDPTPIAGLYNHYIPFIFPDETSMAYLKPRFKLIDDKLVDVRPNQDWLKSYLVSEEFHSFLRDNDHNYRDFDLYKSFGFTPIAHGLFTLYKKFLIFLRYYYGQGVTDPLLEKILTEFTAEAKEQGTRVYFAILPNLRMFNWSGIWQFFPDRYQLRVDVLSAGGYNIIDVRKALRKSEYQGNALFHDDGLHFQTLANKIIADAIRNELVGDGAVKL